MLAFALGGGIVVASATGARADSPAPPEAPAGSPPPVEHRAQFSLSLNGASTPLAECGGARAVQDAVEARLRRPVFTDAATSDSSFVVGVARSSDLEPWTAHVVECDRSGAELGQRDVVLAAEDCAKRIETLAVVLAIMIGPPRNVPGPAPTAPTPELAPSPPPADQGQARPQPPKPPAPPPSAAVEPRRRSRWTVTPLAELAVGTGVLPGLAWAVQGGVVLEPPSPLVSFMARGQYWPAASSGKGPEADFDRVSLSLMACHGLIRSRKVTLSLCAGVDGGRLHVDAPTLTQGSDTSRLLLDVLAEARAGYPLGTLGNLRFEAVLAAQIAAVLRRDRFTYRDRSGRELTLLQPAPVLFQGSFGLAVHFL